ncbi:MAG TPA: PDZ domain-containing protein [Vicinamibacterales bacterium]|nr:PDZ domain-containing protein [Vicinamibacterales bacterium]
MKSASCLVILALVLLAGPSSRPFAAEPNQALSEFLAAGDPAAAAKRIDAVLKSGPSFSDVLSALRRGRDYPAKAGRGRQSGRFGDHTYAFVVPDNYDPSRSYPVRVQLHGGISRQEPPDVSRLGIARLPGAVEEIQVFPAGWFGSSWWQASQVDNLSRILDKLKRTYNVDENRVYLTGISDGGTGVYFMAFRDTTPWASFLPLNGQMTVLASTRAGVDGLLFPANAVNKPFFVVNGGRDPLYPAHLVAPFVEHLARLGTDVVFRVKADAGHDTNWWPQERPRFETFVDEHPRDPLPDRITWETERVDRYNRAHWLVIDRLGATAGDADFADSNLLRPGKAYYFGLRTDASEDHGRRVIDVSDGSNASRLGLRRGDVLREVDGHRVADGSEVVQRMQAWAVGSEVQLKVERGGQRTLLEGRYQPEEVEMPAVPIFPRGKASGRVDLVRRGNSVEASTRGVRAFTLLLSPSKFDFRQPVRVTANGRVVFDRIVEPSTATLLKWAARDNDRTMLFGAEVSIEMGP